MIDFLTIFDSKNDKYFNIFFEKYNLIFSKYNNHGKTAIIKFLLYSLGLDDWKNKKIENININDFIIICSIDSHIFLRVHDYFYEIDNNDNPIEIDKNDYIHKIFNFFGVEKFPYIKDKNKNYDNKYIDPFLTFFYMDPDASGKSNDQLKCKMYNKNDLRNCFYLIWKNDVNNGQEFENNIALFNEIRKNNLELDEYKKSKQIFKKIISILDINNDNKKIKIFADDEIKKISNDLEEQNKELNQIYAKIDDENSNLNVNNRILESLEMVESKMNKSIDIYFEPERNNFKNYDDFFPCKMTISLSDFYKEYGALKALKETELLKTKDIIKEKIKKLELKKEQILKEIEENRKILDEIISKKDINNILSEYLIEDVLEININQIKEKEEQLEKSKKELKKIEKNINEIIKNQKKEYEEKMKQFEKEYNFFGGTNSSRFKNQFLDYSLLTKIYNNVPLIIDAFESFGIENNKINTLLEFNKHNQKIITMTDKDDELHNSFKDLDFKLTDLSDKKYLKNVICNDFVELEFENKKSFELINSFKCLNIIKS